MARKSRKKDSKRCLTRLVLSIAALLVLAGMRPAFAQQPWYDPCTTGLKSTVSFNISSATTTSLIAPVTGANIYVCSFDVNQAGGTGTILFEYGTGSTCGTGTQTITGPFTANTSAGTTTNVSTPNHGYTQFNTVLAGVANPSVRLCALSTGTIVQSGYLLYVQQ
jgi:hypothetical protein